MIGVVANTFLASLASRKAIAPEKSQVILLMGGLRTYQGLELTVAMKYKKLIRFKKKICQVAMTLISKALLSKL
ncbi:hypothetical protein [Arthrospira platensis]|uniref:Uncharacterized protein n=1 Tax=Limnospira platensis NIES-46 TaxID=1236695 RepID=A0A5M3T6Q4_LIMPL|nr:hypothetical protein [Arthrospira platensis]AMW27061.1 hypothetical protein AP285_02720 [Arthrospira platensis YZ]KDR57073.1 hypothetical protein APPUASWS_013150 [Arthrospira platensis str. Paraca]MBD2670792.1 hypothetical protein [Arthrospira platensis FACHB-439]MBD2711518.1 hypothetical protein [Arthrospira platensis FACHB-835]MDF2211484.1 hypothetical protein [Arthrospira platensis NCB002]QQW29804.1 hypothetical protein AP9108_02855 [Arthrospira sp. PCC 9108]BAI88480.1 hypothetical pro